MDYLNLMQRGRLGLVVLLAAATCAPLHAQAPPRLDRAEYFFDTDPGYGAAAGVPLGAPAPDLANVGLLADASALADGPRRLFVRSRDASGRWSQVLGSSFTKSGCVSSPNLAGGSSGPLCVTTVGGTACSAQSYTYVDSLPSKLPHLTLAPVPNPLCPGTAYDLTFTVTGNPFPAGTVVRAQVASPQHTYVEALGSTSFSGLGTGTIRVVTPHREPRTSSFYRIELYASTPFDANSNTLSITDIPPLGVVKVSSNSPVTVGDTLALNVAYFSPGSNPYSWTYTPVGGSPRFFSNEQNPRIPNAQLAQAGRYRVMTTGYFGCTDTASVFVEVRPVVPLTTITLSALSAGGPQCVGAPFLLGYTVAGQDFNASNTLSAVLSDANGAFSASSPVIGAAPVATAGAGALRVAIPAATPTGSGYRVRLMSNSPAYLSNAVDLSALNLTTAVAGSNTPVVAGATILLTATGIAGAAYAWTGPNGYAAAGPNQTISGATAANAGAYQVTISLSGCATTAGTTVVVRPGGPAASIQTGALAASYCAGAGLLVPFTANGFAANNVFTAQLSTAGGVFSSNPVSIGTANADTTNAVFALIPAGTPVGAGYRIRVVGSQPATVGTDNGSDVVITAKDAYTWLGTANSSYSEAQNWSCSTPPSAETDVVIPAGRSRYPVSGLGDAARNLTIEKGASLTFAGVFELSGNLLNDGALTVNENALECQGRATPQTFGGTGNTRLDDLIVWNPAGVVLRSPLGVRHLLKLNFGNLESNGFLTLLSDATGTALVVSGAPATSPAGDGTVTGRATMERYVPAAGAPGYRHFSSPMRAGTATVQEFADDVPGFNLNPDYNTVGNAALPFPTLFRYDEARLTAADNSFDRGWAVPLAPDDLTPGRGYSVQAVPGSVVDLSGTLARGDVRYPLTRGPYEGAGWCLLGNPFPAPLDWDLVPAAAGVDRALYVFEPAGPYAGTYRSYVNGISQNGGSKDLAAMQGFFVRATSPAATLTLPEAARATFFPSVASGRGPVATAPNGPLVRLRVRNASGQADEAVVYFEAAATVGFDPAYDAYKVQLNGSGMPSVWSLAGADALAINALPGLATASIALGVRVGQAGPHTLEAAELLHLPAGTEAWLEDRELGVRQNLASAPSYAFTMRPGYAGQRFYLGLRAGPALGTAAAALQAATRLYPNPAARTATLEMTGLSGPGDVQLELMNALGQLVLKRRVQPRAGTVHEQLDLTYVAAGVYSVRILTKQGPVVKRLVRE